MLTNYLSTLIKYFEDAQTLPFTSLALGLVLNQLYSEYSEPKKLPNLKSFGNLIPK